MWSRICVVRMPRRKNHIFESEAVCVFSFFSGDHHKCKLVIFERLQYSLCHQPLIE